jgi:hypothetical protein
MNSASAEKYLMFSYMNLDVFQKVAILEIILLDTGKAFSPLPINKLPVRPLRRSG